MSQERQGNQWVSYVPNNNGCGYFNTADETCDIFDEGFLSDLGLLKLSYLKKKFNNRFFQGVQLVIVHLLSVIFEIEKFKADQLLTSFQMFVKDEKSLLIDKN